MERKFLEDLGLEKTAIDSVMAEHGKTIQAEKAKVQQAESELKTAQATIEKMNEKSADVEAVKAEARDYKAKYEQAKADKDALERNNKIREALIVNQANEKYYDILTSKIGDDVDLDKLSEEITKLKESHGELFQVEKPTEKDGKGYKVIDNKLKEGSAPGEHTKESIMKIEDKKERQRLISENLDLFN